MSQAVGSVAANSYKVFTMDISQYWPYLYYGANLNIIGCGITSAVVKGGATFEAHIRNFTSSVVSPNIHIMLKQL